ncbi:MAG: hypothetical protein ACRD2P_13885 [Terriglobia bacterium]
MREKLIAHINQKNWWHVPPLNPTAYQKRGKFYASSFREAEFWGRPLDQPQHVCISNPLIGDEDSLETELFGRSVRVPDPESPNVLEWRWRLDAKMKKAALTKGYDAIVLITPKAFAAYKECGKIPRSVELNVLKS